MRIAPDEAERALLWKGRKTAFGAIARIKPNYYLHDTVVPRRKLPEVLEQVYEIAARHDLLVMNVFHAGDGNLHPLLVFDAREPGVMDRVHAAGEEIVRVSVAAGGVLERRARHRPREARPHAADVLRGRSGRPRRPSPARSTRAAVEPGQGAAEPGRLRRHPQRARGCVGVSVDDAASTKPSRVRREVGAADPVTITASRHTGRAGRRVSHGEGTRRHRVDPAGEMTVWCGAGTPVDEVDAALAEHGQASRSRRLGTVGGALAVGHSDIRRLGYGPVRDVLLQARYVSAAGEVVKAGGPTVKNVSGFDLCRLLVGSRGTLGFLGEVILRTRPRPIHEQWFQRPAIRGGCWAALSTDVGALGRSDDLGAARRASRRRR